MKSLVLSFLTLGLALAQTPAKPKTEPKIELNSHYDVWKFISAKNMAGPDKPILYVKATGDVIFESKIPSHEAIRLLNEALKKLQQSSSTGSNGQTGN